jgi:catechol 2,3-dioxygenase-like lactoylglutathione lyase family enzyme
MKPQPLIAVRDVEASSRWYRQLLGCESGHGGPEYERLLHRGELILQLHHWGDHDHPNLGDPDEARHGYGVLLWFETGNLDGVIANARALRAEIVEERRWNASARQHECWLRDPDGYVLVIAHPE